MNLFKQTMIEVSAHKYRNILLCVLIFTFTTFYCLAFFLKGTVNNIYNIYAKQDGYSIAISCADNYVYADWIPIMEEIVKFDYVEGFNVGGKKIIKCNVKQDATCGQNHEVYMFGNINTEYSEYFRKGDFELISGVYPETGKNEVLIDEIFSRENYIEIGDNVEVVYNESTLNLKVVGKYKVTRVPKIDEDNDGFYAESQIPILYCDYISYETVSYDRDFSVLFVYADKLEHVNNVKNAIMQLLGEEAQVISSIESHTATTGTTIKVLTFISEICIKVSSFIFLLCLCLLTVIWTRDHMSTINILNALGQKKIAIIGRILMEILLICIPVSVLSALLNATVLDNIGETIINRIIFSSGNNIILWDPLDADMIYELHAVNFVIPAVISNSMVFVTSLIVSVKIVCKNKCSFCE